MKNNTKAFLWTQCGLAVFLVAAGTLTLTRARAGESTVSIPAPQLVRAINAASAAKPGTIAEVEVERENGQILVDVDILAADGQKYEVSVEAATGKVLSVALDKEDDKEEKGGEEAKDGEVEDGG